MDHRPPATAPERPRSPARRRTSATYADLRSWFAGEGRLVASTIAGLAVVCLCGAVIAALIDDVSEFDGVTRFDHRVLSWVLDHRSPAWTATARTVTRLGDPWVITVIVALAFVLLFRARRIRLGCFVVLASAGAAIASSVAKQAIDRSRPPMSVWLAHAWGPSFPSGHATQSIACWGALAIVACVLIRSRRWRAVVLVAAAAIAFVVGTSRIYLGVHWLSDVVCGWALASLWLTTLLLAGWCTPRLLGVWVDRRTDPIPTDPTTDPASTGS